MADLERRRLWIGVGVGAVLVLGLGVWFAAGLGGGGASDEATARANVALSQLSRCLLGPPLGAGERPSTRLRNVELASRTSPAARDWPERCATHAQRIGDELEDAAGEDERYRTVHRHARAAQRALDQSRLPGDLDGLFDTALAIGLVAVPGADAPAPPDAVSPLRREDLRVIAPAPGILTATDPVAGPVTHLAFSDPDGPWRICTLAHDLGSVECRGLAALRGRAAAAIVSSAPGAPPHLQVQRGAEPGIYQVDSGSRVFDGTPLGAFARRDGTLAVIDGRDLVQIRDVNVRTALGAPEGGPIAMVWDRVIWLGTAPPGQPRPFLVRRVPAGIAPPDPAEAIGTGPILPRADEFVMAACRSESALAIVVRSVHEHEKNQPTTVALLTDGGENATLQTTTDIYGPELSCLGETAAITWLLTEPAGFAIHQRLCTLQGCERASVSVPFRGSDPFVGRVGDRTMIAWKSPLGDTRVRIAPLAELPGAPELVLFDDGAHGGLDVLSRRMLLRGDHAILVLRSRAGAHAIRIGADGSYAAVTP